MLVFLQVLAVEVQSQDFLVQKYTEEQGLPSSMVFSIAQSSDGYMFFATRNGIARYNGYEWKTGWRSFYKTLTNRGAFQKDNNGDLWFYSPNVPHSLYLYKNGDWRVINSIPVEYLASGEYMTYTYAVDVKSPSTRIMLKLPEKGLGFFDGKKWRILKKPNELFVNHIILIDNTFYIASSSGIYTYGTDNVLRKVNIPTPNQDIKSIAYSDSDKKLWVLGYSFLGHYDFNKFTIVSTNEKLNIYTPNEKISLIPDYYNIVLIGSLHSMIQVFTDRGLVYQFGVRNGLIDNSAREIFIDREKNIWVAADRGVSKIASLRFVNYNAKDGLLEDEVTSVIENNGKHYLGHNRGVTIAYGPKNTLQIPLPDADNGTRVLDMDLSPEGEVYMACASAGLYKITQNDALIKLSAPFEEKQVQSILFDKNGNFYVTTRNHFYVRYRGSSEYKKLAQTVIQYRKLFLAPDGVVWITTIGEGIVSYKDGQMKRYMSDDIDLNNTISVDFTDPRRYLIGTIRGLAVIEDGKIEPFKEKIENLDRPIYFIKNFDGVYWFGTDGGVVRYQNGRAVSYGVREGLAGLETNRDACFLDRNNYLWIGTNRGLSRYNSKFDNLNSTKPICRIYSVSLNDERINLKGKNKISYSFKNLVFSIEVLSFMNEAANKVKYKLIGYDNKWNTIKSGKDFEVVFRQLPAGNYRLAVAAVNPIGVESDIVYSEEFEIEKPFYLTITFIIGIFVAVLIMVYLGTNYYTNRNYRTKLENEVHQRTAQLAASELRYKQMFVDNNAIMLIVDSQSGLITDANPSALEYYGIDFTNISSISIFDITADYFENKQQLIEIISKEKLFTCKHKILNGFIRDVVLHISHISIYDKSLVYIIVEDITERNLIEGKLKTLNSELEEIVAQRTAALENSNNDLKTEMSIRKRTERELFEANEKLFLSLEKEKELGELKSRFISMISHEYRTPLTVILSSAYLIKESIKRNLHDELDRHLFKIHASVTSMSRLLEDVLTYGKAEEGTLSIKVSEFDLVILIKEVITEVDTNDQSKHSIIFDFDEQVNVSSDRYLMRQIISNIMLNAVKFSEPGTSIDVRLNVESTEVFLEIRDQGKGISDDDLELIFDPFYKNSKTIGIIPGTGLGLAIVKKCAELLNCEIEVNNKLQKGTAFSLRFERYLQIENQNTNSENS